MAKKLNLKIDRLILAMAEHEGWRAPGDEGFPSGSRSFRNHNPLNLRSSPFEHNKQDGFSVFRNDAIGFLAAQYDIMQKAKGNTVTKLGPASTLRDLIFTWAPKSDGNNPEAYLQSVIQMTGFKESMTLKEIIS
jgi:hypothetical protein